MSGLYSADSNSKGEDRHEPLTLLGMLVFGSTAIASWSSKETLESCSISVDGKTPAKDAGVSVGL
jgi:hypothetical protein